MTVLRSRRSSGDRRARSRATQSLAISGRVRSSKSLSRACRASRRLGEVLQLAGPFHELLNVRSLALIPGTFLVENLNQTSDTLDDVLHRACHGVARYCTIAHQRMGSAADTPIRQFREFGGDLLKHLSCLVKHLDHAQGGIIRDSHPVDLSGKLPRLGATWAAADRK